MRARGYSLVELLAAILVTAIVMGSAGMLFRNALAARTAAGAAAELERDLRFALERIETALRGTPRVMVPLPWATTARDVLAVVMDPLLDRDGDGVADADNDRNGVVDDDLPADETNDGAPGIVDIDDNGDGRVDEGGDNTINDEAGTAGAAPVLPKRGADWIDVVAFRVVGGSLVERIPRPGAASGRDYDERVIARNVMTFAVERLATGRNRAVEIRVTLTLGVPGGASASRTLRMREGGR